MSTTESQRRGARSAAPDRFAWHPEPNLIDVAAPGARESLDAAGRAAWSAALDYLYDEALRRAMGEPAEHGALRREFFGATGGPAPAPAAPTASSELIDDFRTRIAPHQLNAWHPRNFAYFTPPPLAMSILGELLAQVTQQGVDVWHAGPVAAFVEEEVVRWLCDLAGYDAGSFGLLTSGGVMANFLAMALVRDVHVRRVRGLDGPPRGRALENVRVYTSDQTHFSVARALDELGFPPDTLVVLPADNEFPLPADAVGDAVRVDRAAGRTPAAIAAVAGSTNTGSVDDVASLAEVARREDLWLHVDAAYGAAARLSSELRTRVEALEQADTVTVDPHKWFFQAYDIGGLVVRDGRLLRATFDRSPEYYRGGEAAGVPAGEHGPADEDAPADEAQLNFYKLGFEGTRRWRALKLWLSWKHVGSSGFARLVEGNVELAERLALRWR